MKSSTKFIFTVFVLTAIGLFTIAIVLWWLLMELLGQLPSFELLWPGLLLAAIFSSITTLTGRLLKSVVKKK